MDAITCPQCGTVNPASATHCAQCSTDLQLVLRNIAGVEAAQVPKQKEERKRLFNFVGWMAGTLTALMPALVTSPGSYGTPGAFFTLLALALILGALVGPFGGRIGARLAKDYILAVQIASAAFFSALGMWLLGYMCASCVRDWNF